MLNCHDHQDDVILSHSFILAKGRKEMLSQRRVCDDPHRSQSDVTPGLKIEPQTKHCRQHLGFCCVASRKNRALGILRPVLDSMFQNCKIGDCSKAPNL